LKETIKNLVWTGGVGSEAWEVMINARHEEALKRARSGLVASLEALRGELSFDLVAVDLRAAVGAIGEIVGKTTTEDLLDAIFSQFCLGK
jgi:tRNA modification GTPase